MNIFSAVEVYIFVWV